MKFWALGEWQGGDRLIEVRNPYDGALIDTVPKASAELVRQAIAYAHGYDFGLTAWERFEILRKVHDGIQRRADELARTISLESGKTVRDAHIEIRRSLQTFLFSAEEAKRITGETVAVDASAGMPSSLGIVIREPLGVVVAIGPFNYPLNLLAHKVGPAIAANNAVVVKPASSTPLTALKMAELFIEAGAPPRMLQVITGDARELSDALVTDPRVRKITFTGSIPVGKAICAKAGLQSVCMELGGNDPLIVLNDADLDKCIPVAVDGAFGNNGERCTSIKRIIIEAGIADRFLERFAAETAKLKVGDQLDPATDVGPLIDAAAAAEIEEKVSRSITAGARLVLGNRREGALYWPTILDHVTPNMAVVADETFGPVAPLIRVADFEEALRVANDTPFGLQSGIFTNDLAKAMAAARRLKAGAVKINKGPGFRAEHLPFGGVKDSGIGREGVKYAVESMTTLKTIVI